MVQTKDAQLSSIILIFRFFILVFISLLALFFERVPQLVLPTSTLFLFLGISAFVYGMQTTKKTKQVLDYEKIIFLGRERNAIVVRNFLQALGFTGLWFIGIGIISLCPAIAALRR